MGGTCSARAFLTNPLPKEPVVVQVEWRTWWVGAARTPFMAHCARDAWVQPASNANYPIGRRFLLGNAEAASGGSLSNWPLHVTHCVGSPR